MNSTDASDIKNTLFYKIAKITGGVDEKAGVAKIDFCKALFLLCLSVIVLAVIVWAMQYLITFVAIICAVINLALLYLFQDTVVWDVLLSLNTPFIENDNIIVSYYMWINIPITAVLLSVLYFSGKSICKKLSFEKSFVSTSDDTEVTEVTEKEEDLLVGSYSQYALKNIATGELLRKSLNSNEVVTWSDLFAAKEFYDKKIMTKKHFKIVGFD